MSALLLAWARVRRYVRVCVRACMRVWASVRACAYGFVGACLCVHAIVRTCVHAKKTYVCNWSLALLV